MTNILVEVEGKVCIVRFNRPEARNSINGHLLRELTQTILELPKKIYKKEVHSLVITGEGDVFCSGGDFKDKSHRELTGRSFPDEVLRFDYNPLFTMLRNLEIPIVVAVNGPAIGVGVAFSLMGDICYASQNTFFQLNFSRLSLASECGVSYLLPRMVGYRQALDIALSGDKISVDRALEIGLINAIYPDRDKLIENAVIKARDLGERKDSIRLIRQIYRESWKNSFEEQLELEARLTREAFDAALASRKSE